MHTLHTCICICYTQVYVYVTHMYMHSLRDSHVGHTGCTQHMRMWHTNHSINDTPYTENVFYKWHTIHWERDIQQHTLKTWHSKYCTHDTLDPENVTYHIFQKWDTIHWKRDTPKHSRHDTLDTEIVTHKTRFNKNVTTKILHRKCDFSVAHISTNSYVTWLIHMWHDSLICDMPHQL